ncbi:MAG: radical SAM protein [Opitutae bacterium]|nr:radical SAM protein [Opitutae bacterium]
MATESPTIDAPEPLAILNWQMTFICNFNCHYCFGHELGGTAESVPVAKVVACLQATGRKWQVNLVGGEVFLIPDFLETCIALQKAGMMISVETNLSLGDRVAEFCERIDPTRVESIHISTHIEEREKRKGVDRFIEDIGLLRRKGFNVYVNYVLHPSLFPRFQADYDRFAAQGILLKPAPFIGQYAGENYPEAYTTRERQILLKANPQAGTYTGLPARGMACAAGRDFAVLDNGVFYRCNAFIGKLGDIDEGFHLYDGARMCPVRICPCWGYRFLTDRKKADRLARRFRRSSLHVALKNHALTRVPYRGLCRAGNWLKTHPALRAFRQRTARMKDSLRNHAVAGPLYRRMCRMKDAVLRKLFPWY